MEKTEKQYKQLGAEERAVIMLMQQDSRGLREIGRFLNRSPSTISREHIVTWGLNQATLPHWRANRRTA